MKKTLLIACILLTVFILFLLVNKWFFLRKAHSTFDNYYTFRGCVQLLEKEKEFGICKTNSGQTIKIVKYHDKWYLDGDLPWACIKNICFGI